MDLGDRTADFRFLVRDRAGQFTASFNALLASAGIEAVKFRPGALARMPMRKGSCSRPGPRSPTGCWSSASGICRRSWPGTRPITTVVVPIAAVSSFRPGLTTLPLTFPGSEFSAGPSLAASSANTSEPPKSPGQD